MRATRSCGAARCHVWRRHVGRWKTCVSPDGDASASCRPRSSGHSARDLVEVVLQIEAKPIGVAFRTPCCLAPDLVQARKSQLRDLRWVGNGWPAEWAEED